jgi:hypothetical protein
MAPHLRLLHHADDRWEIAMDGKVMLAFAGPRARELAERELIEIGRLLENSADVRSTSTAGRDGRSL